MLWEKGTKSGEMPPAKSQSANQRRGLDKSIRAIEIRVNIRLDCMLRHILTDRKIINLANVKRSMKMRFLNTLRELML